MARKLVTDTQQQASGGTTPEEKMATGLKNILSTLMGAAKSSWSPVQRTAQFAQDYASYAPEAFKAGQASKGQDYQTRLAEQKSIASKYGMTTGREAGVGAEIAFLGAPVGEALGEVKAGAGALKVLATSAKAAGIPGFVYGFTDPELKTLKDRILSGLTAGTAATVIAPVLNKIFTSIGLGAAKIAIGAKVSEADPFAVPGEMMKATEAAIKSTKLSDLSLGDMATSMGKVRTSLNNEIKSAVSKVTKVFDHDENFTTTLEDYIKAKMPRFKYQNIGSMLTPFTDLIRAVAGGEEKGNVLENLPQSGGEANDLVKKTAQQIVGYVRDMRYGQGSPELKPVYGTTTTTEGGALFKPSVGGIQEEATTAMKYTLEGLNNARMAIGEFLSDQGAWERSRLGKLTKPEQKIGEQVYFYIRDLIDKETRAVGADISGKLNQEHLLYEAANGIAARVSGSTGRPSTLIRSAPGLAIRYLFDPVSILMGRAAASSTVKQAALEKILNFMGQGGQPPGQEQQ